MISELKLKEVINEKFGNDIIYQTSLIYNEVGNPDNSSSLTIICWKPIDKYTIREYTIFIDISNEGNIVSFKYKFKKIKD